MKYAKILSLVLALIMSVSVMAGCSKEEDKKTDQPQQWQRQQQWQQQQKR